MRIALGGAIGVGKDTVACHLADMLSVTGRVTLIRIGDLVRADMAADLKRRGRGTEPIRPRATVTAGERAVLQEWGRSRRVDDPRYWLSRLEDSVRALTTPHAVLVDTRTPQEHKTAHDLGFVTVTIELSEAERARRQAARDGGPLPRHLTEADEYRPGPTDVSVVNDLDPRTTARSIMAAVDWADLDSNSRNGTR